MARPPSDIRTAVLGAIGAGPCTLVDVVRRANVGYAAARYTVQNALRGGAVQVCGQEKRAHAKRWLAIYELCEPIEEEAAQGAAGDGCAMDFEQLGCAVRAWSALVES